MQERTNVGQRVSGPWRIFVINPGSTSTKVSLFEGGTCVFDTDVFHDSPTLRALGTINDQLDYRMEVLDDFLATNGIDLTGVDAVVGRGGGCYPVESGIYTIDDRLVADTRDCKGGLYHASMLGVQMAQRVHARYGGIALMVNPPIVDELCEDARITVVRGVYRKAVSHALNLKAVARRHCEEQGISYQEHNFIVSHIDGGISVTAHRRGRMVDGNDAGGGEGPFTPTRMGSMAVTDVLHYLYGKKPEEIQALCSQAGGLSSWFGTSNSDQVHALVEADDPVATRVWSAMIYQTCKWIASMGAVLEGQVDAILLTGGLLRFDDVVQGVRDRCGWIAPVYVYPGEFEQQAMAQSACDVLSGDVEPRVYPGAPVWSGFAEG